MTVLDAKFGNGVRTKYSCSTSLNGRMFIFGGEFWGHNDNPVSRDSMDYSRQVIEVGECGLKEAYFILFRTNSVFWKKMKYKADEWCKKCAKILR